MFFLVDAFTHRPFNGNPAGVCVVEEFQSDAKLQEIAGYFNWSEIAFIKKLSNSAFQIRWFSPLDEAPLCGHATLAAAHIVSTHGLTNSSSMTFMYNTGEIATRVSPDGMITMSFPAKQVSRCDAIPFDVRDVIGIDEYLEVVEDDTLYIIVLRDPQDVFRAIPNFEAIKNVDCRAIAITARYNDQYDFCSRYFAPKVGIFEDPVCGSMHCRLAVYWNAVLDKYTFNAYQASSRSGALTLRLDGDTVDISGAASTVSEIKLY